MAYFFKEEKYCLTWLKRIAFAHAFADKKACRDEENRIIWRDVLLPIPEDIDLKVEVRNLSCSERPFSPLLLFG